MKTSKWLIVAALPLMSILGCQKQISSEDSEATGGRNPQLKTLANCNTCVANWDDSKETVISDVSDDFYIDVKNDGTNIYITFRRLNATFTKVKNVLVKQGTTTIYTIDQYGSGAVYSLTLPAIAFIQPLVKCTPISISLEAAGVGGGGGKVYNEFFYYLREKCAPVVCDLTNFQTRTQGYYMAAPPGAEFLLANNLSVTIGCGSNTASYTAQQIIDLEPGNSEAPGVFAKQIIALALNLKADAIWGHELDCLKIVSGPFTGWTAAQVLTEANAVYGGCSVAHTEAQMLPIVDAINNNFDNGKANNGVLTCGSCQ